MARPKGGYTLADGTAVPGVTTVVGMLAKPALIGWAGKLCVQAGYDAGRAGEPMPRWNDVCYGQRDEAAAAGTQAHDLFERHLRGQPIPPMAECMAGAWQAYNNAVHWLEDTGLEVEPYEEPIVSETMGYAGTPDALCTDKRGRRHLADWKTGGVYGDHILQMAAYRALLGELGIDVEGVHLVRFSRDHGDFAHHYFDADALDVGWRAFRGLLDAWPHVQAVQKRAK